MIRNLTCLIALIGAGVLCREGIVSRKTRRPRTRAAVVLAALAMALVPACTDRVANPTVLIPSDFTLAVGQHVTVQPDNVEIGFREVNGDSRCPTSLMCFWQGEAGVQLKLTNAIHQTQQVRISVEGHGSGTVETMGYRITAVRLDPYPRDAGPIPQFAYRVTLHVERSEPSVKPSRPKI